MRQEFSRVRRKMSIVFGTAMVMGCGLGAGLLPAAEVVGGGSNATGQTTPPEGLSEVTAIAGGYCHNVALRADGTVIAWGDNEYGQTTPPEGLSEVTAIAAGNYHSLALRADGTVIGWGDNGYAQSRPPADLRDVVAVAAGGYHSLALRADGTVVGWGRNQYDQATPPKEFLPCTAIAAGRYHSLALRADGTVVGWGLNKYGQATPLEGLSNVVAIAAGGWHSLALRADGTVVGWGRNNYSQATPPEGLTNVVAIAAGSDHSLALLADGTVMGWGSDSFGKVTAPYGVRSAMMIAAGTRHSLARINRAPRLAPVPPVTINADHELTLPLVAADPDVPLQTLTYRLAEGVPEGAGIDPTTGVFTWTPPTGAPAGDYLVTVRVEDDGQPARAAETTFTITVIGDQEELVLQPPTLLPDGSVRLQWNATAGVTYVVEAGEKLGGEWRALGEVTPSGAEAQFTDPDGPTHAARFYRVRRP
jgi:hypothetical protein